MKNNNIYELYDGRQFRIVRVKKNIVFEEFCFETAVARRERDASS